MLYIFFFKQKTAYEMRISDWSSDVCSSDLLDFDQRQQTLAYVAALNYETKLLIKPECSKVGMKLNDCETASTVLGKGREGRGGMKNRPDEMHARERTSTHRLGIVRSEEHTSELQSLMRISYAVFCLKKKNNKQ